MFLLYIYSRVCVPYVQHCRVGVPTCDSLSCVVFLICRAVFLTYVVVFPTVILQYFPNLYCVSNLKVCVPNLQLFVPNLLVCVSNLHTCSCVPYLQMCSQLSFSFPYCTCTVFLNSKGHRCVSKLAALCLFCTDMYSLCAELVFPTVRAVFLSLRTDVFPTVNLFP